MQQLSSHSLRSLARQVQPERRAAAAPARASSLALELEVSMSVVRKQQRKSLDLRTAVDAPQAAEDEGAKTSAKSGGGPLQAYQRALQQKPLLTKALTCAAGSLLGDGLAQMAGGSPFELHRNLSLTLYGLLVGGPLGHYWHAYLDRTVMPSKPQSSGAVAGKLAMDQLLMAPVANVLLFAFLELAKGTPEQTMMVVQEKTWSMLCANWMVWPLVQLIAFRYIKQDWRILYANIIGVIWCAYVSLVVFAAK